MANRYIVVIPAEPDDVGKVADKLREEQLEDVEEKDTSVTFKLESFDREEARIFTNDLLRELFGPDTYLTQRTRAFRTLR
jgi:hypothetical protein